MRGMAFPRRCLLAVLAKKRLQLSRRLHEEDNHQEAGPEPGDPAQPGQQQPACGRRGSPAQVLSVFRVRHLRHRLHGVDLSLSRRVKPKGGGEETLPATWRPPHTRGWNLILLSHSIRLTVEGGIPQWIKGGEAEEFGNLVLGEKILDFPGKKEFR